VSLREGGRDVLTRGGLLVLRRKAVGKRKVTQKGKDREKMSKLVDKVGRRRETGKKRKRKPNREPWERKTVEKKKGGKKKKRQKRVRKGSRKNRKAKISVRVWYPSRERGKGKERKKSAGNGPQYQKKRSWPPG